MRVATWVMVIGLIAAVGLAADVVWVYTEERIEGREASLPLPGLEGILDALFETDHIAVEPGAGRLPVDWENQGFRAADSLARQAAADALLLVRFTTDRSPAGGRITSRAAFWLMEAAGFRLIAREEMDLDNEGRPEADARRLGFELGARVARRAIRLWEDVRGGK